MKKILFLLVCASFGLYGFSAPPVDKNHQICNINADCYLLVKYVKANKQTLINFLTKMKQDYDINMLYAEDAAPDLANVNIVVNGKVVVSNKDYACETTVCEALVIIRSPINANGLDFLAKVAKKHFTSQDLHGFVANSSPRPLFQ